MYKNYKKVNKRLYQNLLRFFFALIYLRIEEDFELKNSLAFKNRWPTSDVSDIHSTPSNRYGYDRGSNRDRKSCLLRADSRGVHCDCEMTWCATTKRSWTRAYDIPSGALRLQKAMSGSRTFYAKIHLIEWRSLKNVWRTPELITSIGSRIQISDIHICNICTANSNV